MSVLQRFEALEHFKNLLLKDGVKERVAKIFLFAGPPQVPSFLLLPMEGYPTPTPGSKKAGS